MNRLPFSFPILITLLIGFVATVSLSAQDRDIRSERIVLDDGSGSSLIISAPNLSGDRTLTLPDAAGEILLNSRLVLATGSVADGDTIASEVAVAIVDDTNGGGGSDGICPVVTIPLSPVHGQILYVATNDPDGAKVDDDSDPMNGVQANIFDEEVVVMLMYLGNTWRIQAP